MFNIGPGELILILLILLILFRTRGESLSHGSLFYLKVF